MYVQSGDQPARHEQRLHDRQHNRERAGITHRLVWWQQHNKRRQHDDNQAPYRDEVVPPPQQDYQSKDRAQDSHVPSTQAPPVTKKTFIPDPSRLFEGIACLGIAERERAHGVSTIIPTDDVETSQHIADKSKSRSIESFLKHNRDSQQERNRSQTAHPRQRLSAKSPAPKSEPHSKVTAVSDDTRADAINPLPQVLLEQRSDRPLEHFSRSENIGHHDELARHETADTQLLQVSAPHAQDRSQEFFQHFEKVTAGIRSRQESVTKSAQRKPQLAVSGRVRSNRGDRAIIGVHRRSRTGLSPGKKNFTTKIQRGGGGIAAHTTQQRDLVATTRQLVSEIPHSKSVHSDTEDVSEQNHSDIDHLMSRKRNEHAHWTQSSVRRGSYFGMFEQEAVNQRRRELVERARKSKQDREEDLSALPPRVPFAPSPSPPTRRYDGPATRNRREHQNWSEQSSLRRGSYFGLYAIPSAQDGS